MYKIKVNIQLPRGFYSYMERTILVSLVEEQIIKIISETNTIPIIGDTIFLDDEKNKCIRIMDRSFYPQQKEIYFSIKQEN